MARESIYWDAVAFLGMLNDEPDKSQKCDDVWVAAEKGHFLIVTSCLTIAEVIYIKGTPKLDQSKRVRVSAFFRAPHIAQRPVTRAIAELARDVVWDCNVKPKDAIHVATAAFHKIKTLQTFDDGLLKQKVINVGGFDVTCMEPHAPRQLEIKTADE